MPQDRKSQQADVTNAGAEDSLLAARRSKAERVRERGENPFANDVQAERRTMIAEVRAKHAHALVDPEAQRYDPDKVAESADGGSVVLFGRLMARRGFGKASFLQLRDGSGELQLYI